MDYLAHTQKRTQLRNRYLKKRSYQNKKLYTKMFVFLYYEKLKKALCQFKSQGHS